MPGRCVLTPATAECPQRDPRGQKLPRETPPEDEGLGCSHPTSRNDCAAPWHGVDSRPFVCSVTQSCPTLCNPMNCSTPGFSVHHHLPELAQTHVH